MNVLLGETRATCIIKAPWQSPSTRKDLYASLDLSIIPGKRPRATSQRIRSHCVIKCSVWASATEKEGFNSRSFCHVNSHESAIPGWGAPARLLGVFDALEEDTHCQFSWILVAVTRKGTKRGIALLQVTGRGLVLQDVFVLPETPIQAVVLRGPVVLYCTEHLVGIVGKKGITPLDSDPYSDRSRPDNASRRYLVCRADHDVRGLVAVLDWSEKSSECVTVREHRVSGRCEKEWILRRVRSEQVRLIAVSSRSGIAALAEVGGTLSLFNINSGDLLWTVAAKKELENPRSLIFHGGMLMATAGGSKALWGLRMAPTNDTSRQMRSPTLLFPDKCTVISSQGHGHFFAPWRGSILLCNDVNGTHCTDYEFSTVEMSFDMNQLHSGHYIRIVTKNLQKRLDEGVARVTDAAEKHEDKLKMLDHVRALLIEIVSGEQSPTHPQLFSGELEKIISLPERREPTRGLHSDDEDVMETSPLTANIVANGSSSERDAIPFVKLLRSVTGVDQSSRFIIMRVHLSVLDVAHENESSSNELTLQLILDFDRSISAMWDVEEKTGLRPGDECWLTACAPISNMVANSACSLHDLTIILRVSTDRGSSQMLGSFPLPDILASSVAADGAHEHEGNAGLLSFEQTVHAVAQGRSAHELRHFSGREAIARDLKIQTRENLAYLNFKITSITELALAIAKLRAYVDDDVKLRSTCELSANALQASDTALRKLEGEMQAIRDIANNRGGVGYDVDQIQQLLKIQMHVDDAVGLVEEQYLGT